MARLVDEPVADGRRLHRHTSTTVTLTEDLPVVCALTRRVSDPAPRERVTFTASCVQVTGYALDGSTPATSTDTWDFVRNQPGCGE